MGGDIAVVADLGEGFVDIGVAAFDGGVCVPGVGAEDGEKVFVEFLGGGIGAGDR